MKRNLLMRTAAMIAILCLVLTQWTLPARMEAVDASTIETETEAVPEASEAPIDATATDIPAPDPTDVPESADKPTEAPLSTAEPQTTEAPQFTEEPQLTEEPQPTKEPQPTLRSVSLAAGEKAKLTLNLGEQCAVIATFAEQGTATLKTSKSKVCAISNFGTIVAKAEGSAKITATYGKQKATLTVTVVDPKKPVSVSFDSAAVQMNVGDALSLSPRLTPDTAETVFTWKSSKTKVAQVSGGQVTALTEGTAKITATTANKKKATVTITVVDPYKPDSVALDADAAVIGLDETLALRPVLTPETARTTYTWKSSKTKVATVDAQGVVTPHALGAATITVTTANKKKATYTVTVVQTTTPASVIIRGATLIYLAPEGTQQLRTTVAPETARTALRWVSSDESVASVTADGTVTALALGTAIISVWTDNDLSAQCEVQVVPEDSELLKKRLEGIIIGIDPGHQAHQDASTEQAAPGSSRTKKKVSAGCTGVKTHVSEYVVNLDVSLQLRDALEALGATVVMSRTTHDVNISNRQRAEMMNDANCDLVLRIHCNSASSSSKNGIGTYVSKSYGKVAESYEAAQLLVDAMCAVTGANNTGVHVTDEYTGNNWSTVPVCLVEMGYMSNPAEDVKLNTPAYQLLLIDGMIEGIFAFVGR
ncbi:MAG: N-acetylmuramoyl-L-alanine amidase [Clostridia bacterium]|nr:N-acetylmuramoyl-L-alanine amidase [Clostridia bacterium]